MPIAENFAGIVPANRNSGPRNERVSFQEGTDGADGVTAGPRPSSLDAPLPVAQPSSRRQSGTLSSFFSGNSTAQGDRNSQINTTPQPTASRRNRSGTAPSAVDSPLAAGPTAANTGSLPRRRARRGSTLVPTDDAREGSGRPQSWVNDHIMGGRSRRGSAAVRPSVADARLLDTRDGDARGRSASILSEGGAGVEVSLAMDEENRTSRFAEAINASRSPPRSPSPAGRSEASFVDDEHHLDEVVDHLDVIGAHLLVGEMVQRLTTSPSARSSDCGGFTSIERGQLDPDTFDSNALFPETSGYTTDSDTIRLQ